MTAASESLSVFHWTELASVPSLTGLALWIALIHRSALASTQAIFRSDGRPHCDSEIVTAGSAHAIGLLSGAPVETSRNRIDLPALALSTIAMASGEIASEFALMYSV